MKLLVSYLALFLLFSVIDSFEWFWIRKSSQEYPVNAAVPRSSILGPTPFLLYINGLPDDLTCNVAIYADDTDDLWQQIELASELESDYRGTADLWRKWLSMMKKLWY